MVIDFKCLKEAMNEVIKESLDHRNLNEVFGFNPTAENLARWITLEMQSYLFQNGPEALDDEIPMVSKVTVRESEGNTACYIP